MVYSACSARRPHGRVPGCPSDPQLPGRLFAEGAFSAGFRAGRFRVPGPARAREVRELVDGAAGTLAWFLSVSRSSGGSGRRCWCSLRAGFHADAGKFDLTVEMLRWTFPYLLLHLARGPGGRRPEQLREVRRSGDDLHGHEPRHDRVCGLDRASVRAARHRARHRRLRGRRGAARFQVPFMLKLGLLRRRWRWAHEACAGSGD